MKIKFLLIALVLCLLSVNVQAQSKSKGRSEFVKTLKSVRWDGLYMGMQAVNRFSYPLKQMDYDLTASSGFNIRRNYILRFQIIMPVNSTGVGYRAVFERRIF